LSDGNATPTSNIDNANDNANDNDNANTNNTNNSNSTESFSCQQLSLRQRSYHSHLL